MTIVTDRLTDAFQALIDARLDTIDRMLLGVVPRQDRLDIGKEVEAQIFQLLEASGDEPTREDVLAVLARLDPPEAYLSEVAGREAATSPRQLSPQIQKASTKREYPGIGKASAALGIIAMTLMVFLPLVLKCMGFFFPGDAGFLYVLLYFFLGLIFILGSIGTILGVVAMRSGPWAIVGLSTSPFSIVLSLTFAVLGLLFGSGRFIGAVCHLSS